MRLARSAVLITAAVVLVSLALVFLLVRTDLVSAALWSYYPVILAISLAVVFVISALTRRKAPEQHGGPAS